MGPAPADHLRAGDLSRPDPADRATLEGLLARHRFRPVHRLGQNFLVDPALRDRVAGEAGIRPTERVLEVGAGPGALTMALAESAARVVAVELDHRLVGVLREVARRCPAERLLLETDSPFGQPASRKREGQNRPAFLVDTAALVAEVRGISLQELVEIEWQNAHSLFTRLP